MPFVTIFQPDGSSELVDANSGASLMGAATAQGITGIIAECGGAMACATCHVHIDKDWQSVIGAAEGREMDLLSYQDSYDPMASRLSCQIILDDEHEGLKVHIPAE